MMAKAGGWRPLLVRRLKDGLITALAENQPLACSSPIRGIRRDPDWITGRHASDRRPRLDLATNVCAYLNGPRLVVQPERRRGLRAGGAAAEREDRHLGPFPPRYDGGVHAPADLAVSADVNRRSSPTTT